MTKPLIEYIPRVLREPVENPEIVGQTIVTAELAKGTMTVEQAVGFLNGFLAHQNTLARKKNMESGELESKVFPVEIQSITPLERRSGNFVLGTKYEVRYVSDREAERGSTKVESIFTGWTQFNGYQDATWEVALSNSIIHDIEQCESKHMFIRKAFAYVDGLEQGDKVRYIADVWEVANKKGGSTSSSIKVPRRLIKAVESGDIDAIADEVEVALNIELSDEDIDTIDEVFGGEFDSDEDLALAILKEFR